MWERDADLDSVVVSPTIEQILQFYPKLLLVDLVDHFLIRLTNFILAYGNRLRNFFLASEELVAVTV